MSFIRTDVFIKTTTETFTFTLQLQNGKVVYTVRENYVFLEYSCVLEIDITLYIQNIFKSAAIEGYS